MIITFLFLRCVVNYLKECDCYDEKTGMIVPELLQNFIMSSQMEGLPVSDVIQAMCLSVIN